MKKPICSWRDMEAVRQLLAAAEKGDGAIYKMKQCLDPSSVDRWRAAFDVVGVLEESGSLYNDHEHFQPSHATVIARAFRRREKHPAKWTPEMKEEIVAWVYRCEDEELTVPQLRELLAAPREFNLVDEAEAIARWLAARRESWPEDIRDKFTGFVRTQLDHMESDDDAARRIGDGSPPAG